MKSCPQWSPQQGFCPDLLILSVWAATWKHVRLAIHLVYQTKLTVLQCSGWGR